MIRFYLLIVWLLLSFSSPVYAEEETTKKAPAQGQPSLSEQPDISSYMCPQLYDLSAYEKIKKDSYAFLIPGKNSWIFRTESDLKQDFRVGTETQKGLKNFIKALKSRGTDLVIISVPSRGLAHGDQFDRTIPIMRGFNQAIANKHYQERGVLLNSVGIPTVTLTNLKPAQGNFFYKLDHHWTQYGAEMMAKATADFIQKNIQSYKDIPAINFKTHQGEAIEYLGSFSDVVKEICGRNLPTEPAFDPQTTPNTGKISANNLFGETELPDITLVGTSFSTQETSYSNFEGYLKQYLLRDVLNKSISGGGFDTSLLYYLTTPDFHNKPPKILLWEFPSYYSLAEDKRGKELLRQALPSIFGDCGVKAIKTTTTTLTAKSTKIIDDLSITDDQHYISMNFSAPFQKNFRVISHRADSTTDNFRFRRGKRYPADPQYFLAFEDSKSPVQFINIEPHKSMAGLSVTTKLCKMPEF